MIKILIPDLLKDRDCTLYWLAKRSGVRYATIWNLSRGNADRLRIDTLDRICEALECQPGDLLVRVAETKSRKRGK